MSQQENIIEAETYEELVTLALDKFGVDSEDDLTIEVLEEGEKRNLLLQKKKYIKAAVRAKNEKTSDLPPVRPADLEGFLRRIIQTTQIADDLEIAEMEDETLHIELIGFVSEDLQQGREVLDALQHIGARYMFRHGQPRRLNVDAQGLRERRHEELDSLILKIHDTVLSGRVYTTQPLAAGERRKIHVGLEEMGGVRTVSRGNGAKKRIVVYPNNNRRGPRRGRRREHGNDSMPAEYPADMA